MIQLENLGAECCVRGGWLILAYYGVIMGRVPTYVVILLRRNTANMAIVTLAIIAHSHRRLSFLKVLIMASGLK